MRFPKMTRERVREAKAYARGALYAYGVSKKADKKIIEREIRFFQKVAGKRKYKKVV
jgi:hypothetical protein